MNKRLFIIVIFLMGISLAGIILLQLFWIRNAIKLREDQFSKAVNLALRETTEKLESHENLLILNDRITNFGKPVLKLDRDSLGGAIMISGDTAFSTSYTYSIDSDEHTNYNISVWTEEDDDRIVEYKHKIRIDSIRKSIDEVKANVKLDSLSEFLTHEIVFVGNDMDTVISGSDNSYVIVKKAKDLNEAFVKLAYEIETSSPPVEERIDFSLLRDILTAELFDKGVHIPFEFGVMTVDSVQSFPITSESFNPGEINKKFTVSLFPNELLQESNFLALQFPGRNVHILKSMSWTLAGSLLLTLIILATFAITIYMILRQKKLSDIKSDFINNMTHEFKTPIATISLAADSISNPKIIKNEKEVKYYTGIIREENQRMNNQVESVLRMSLLDKHDLEFNMADHDLHALINKAITKVELLLRERNGAISLQLEASHPLASVDADHFTNAMLNLLDNAIKYSVSDPQIEVRTKDLQKDIYISVRDHGMGMRKEVSQRVFDKFYRKTSGNIHNIKGFGLGLSYVKAIVNAFGGDISVKSESGKGSIFEVTIPKTSHNG